MGNIVLLDESTINQIAAGEVIERPANVVKELVENSIDANAKNITIEIKKGGKSFIKIIDDGSGIKADDMLISLERHATSKIRRIEDLENIYSMGFRGEALSSISSISKFTIISKTDDENIGIKLVSEGGKILSQEEVGMRTGTTMIVEELFFNTPVRYKFLKQDFTEFKYIKDFVEKVAMSNPDISFKLINDGKNVFQTNGSGKLEDVLYVLYGKKIKDNITKVDYKTGNIEITGVVGNTFLAEKTRKNQIVFLNKRNIKNTTLMKSADQAFKGSIGIQKYGFYILNIKMPANYYDVNVHPTKKEVRFKDEEQIYQAIYESIKSSLLNEEYLGNNEVSQTKSDYIENEYNFITNHFFKNDIKKDDIPVQKETIKREEKRKIEYKFIGISFKTYIMIEIDNEMYLIDQHAGHERVLYEKIKQNYKNNLQNNTQMMLMPDVIDLSNQEIQFIKNNLQLFKKIGYDIDFFGDNAIKINGIPDLEYKSKSNTKDMFLDVLDEMINNVRSPIKDIEERFIATVACKAAIKAGMTISNVEVDNLIQELMNLQNPYTCPHGRPTAVKFTKNGDINFL